MSIIGLLFAPLPEQRLQALLHDVEAAVQADICPVFVGLLGPGVNGNPDGVCSAWPLLLMLAPYIDVITDRLAAG